MAQTYPFWSQEHSSNQCHKPNFADYMPGKYFLCHLNKHCTCFCTSAWPSSLVLDASTSFKVCRLRKRKTNIDIHGFYVFSEHYYVHVHIGRHNPVIECTWILQVKDSTYLEILIHNLKKNVAHVYKHLKTKVDLHLCDI